MGTKSEIKEHKTENQTPNIHSPDKTLILKFKLVTEHPTKEFKSLKKYKYVVRLWEYYIGM